MQYRDKHKQTPRDVREKMKNVPAAAR
jgi:hypothetical protein